MKVQLLGGPRHLEVIDMGPGWPGTSYHPPIYRVIEFKVPRAWETYGAPVDPNAPLDDLGEVDYVLFGQMGDTLLYRSPLETAFTPSQRGIRIGLLRDVRDRAYVDNDYDGVQRADWAICAEEQQLDAMLCRQREAEWGGRVPPHP